MKVVVNGYTGKMGDESVKAILNEKDLELVGKARRGDDFKALLASTKPDVVLDFTHPDVVYENAKAILESGAVPVIGTTGLTDAQLTDLHKVSMEKKLGVLVCPNFAIGAILMMRFAAEASKYMPRVEIIEFHHDKKADAPSGTAIKTADAIHKVNASINSQSLQETELIPGSRGGSKHRIPIHSVRLPGFVASQEVIFGGLGQTLTIRHDTLNRESFMPGVILAIRKAPQVKGLIYGLEHLL